MVDCCTLPLEPGPSCLDETCVPVMSPLTPATMSSYPDSLPSRVDTLLLAPPLGPGAGPGFDWPLAFLSLSFFSFDSFEDRLLDLLPFSDMMQMIRDCSSNELTEMLVSPAFNMDCLEVVCSYHGPHQEPEGERQYLRISLNND